MKAAQNMGRRVRVKSYSTRMPKIPQTDNQNIAMQTYYFKIQNK